MGTSRQKGEPVLPVYRGDLLKELEQADRAAATGQAQPEAIATASPMPAPAGRKTAPSPREREILLLAARGMSREEIAERLWLSPHTVHRHLTAIYRVLNVHSQAGAVGRAVALGIITPAELREQTVPYPSLQGKSAKAIRGILA